MALDWVQCSVPQQSSASEQGFLQTISACRQPMQQEVFALELGRLEAVSRPRPAEEKEQHYAPTGVEELGKQGALGSGTAPELLQDALWKHLFANSAQWWDNRRSKPSPRHPDFKHKKFKYALWVDNRHKPAWVNSHLSALDEVGVKTTPPQSESVSTTSVVQSHHEAFAIHDVEEGRTCWKLCCEDGPIRDAVEALTLLVQRGYRTVPSNLFYRVVKRCVREKDLVLGRRVHALTVQCGYEGHSFLATHLIGMYASHGRLEDAMAVFTKVHTPDPYNWAAIIFAHARHGEAAQATEAIQLYRQMCESPTGTVKPDDHIYAAVLKACAVAGDLVAGKEVHSHILLARRSPGGAPGPDRYVENALVDMYAKCGSLDDACRVFDGLANRDVVTWTAMVAGYAQQGSGEKALHLYSRMQHEGVVPDSVTFACLLQACASVGAGALEDGKRLHSQIQERGLQEDVVVGGSLVNMYAKCGSLEDARCAFDRLEKKRRNVVTWTSMIAGYAQQGRIEEAFSVYKSMQQQGEEGLGARPNAVTYMCLLQACASVGGVDALRKGEQLHAEIMKEKRGGLLLQEEDVAALGGSLVNMYAKCGSLQDALGLFATLPAKNIVAWNALVAAYAQQGMVGEAFSLYRSMRDSSGGTRPNAVTYVCLLQACASVGAGALREGEEVHAELEKQGLQEDVVVGGSLVNMYAKCGSLQAARNVFESLPVKNVVAWTAMIAGYVQPGDGEEALRLYWGSVHGQAGHNTPPPADSVMFACLLQACACVGVGALQDGKKLHAQIKEQGLDEDGDLLGASFVNMYVKCGSLEDARNMFDRLDKRNVVTWTAMIAGYAQRGRGEEALGLYRGMQREEGLLSAPDAVTYTCLLQACASLGDEGALREGQRLHAEIVERGLLLDDDKDGVVVLGGSLVHMYESCGRLEDARRVLDGLSSRNIVAWNLMIAGYAKRGQGEEALRLYRSMQQQQEGGGQTTCSPDSVTYVHLLQACACVGVAALRQGEELHSEIKTRGLGEDVVLGGSLVNMYAKCGCVEEARRVFDGLGPEKSVVTWNAMIGGYAQQGMGEHALGLHREMQKLGKSRTAVVPDAVTYVCLLQACASAGVGSLAQGEQLHADIVERGWLDEDDVVLHGSLLNMYAKCGRVDVARRLFDRLVPSRRATVATWNTMLAGHAQHGMPEEALALFQRMQQQQQLEEEEEGGPSARPDCVTYVCVLQACAAVAALPLGKQLHAEIERQGMHNDPMVGAALVNMFAKCGCMDDAQRVFDSLAAERRNVEVWGALIGGYARQGDCETVFGLLHRMVGAEGVRPNGVVFLGVLTACSHAGLVDKGRYYFHTMGTEHGVSASIEHYSCMTDMLGRAGYLDEALQMAKSMPWAPTDAVWQTLLGAAWKWKNVEIGVQAFEGAVSGNAKGDAAPYVLMSNIYASAGMWEAAEAVQARRKELGVCKEQGRSWWTDADGVVHAFGAGDTGHE